MKTKAMLRSANLHQASSVAHWTQMAPAWAAVVEPHWAGYLWPDGSRGANHFFVWLFFAVKIVQQGMTLQILHNRIYLRSW
jgi:hypothetical protein